MEVADAASLALLSNLREGIEKVRLVEKRCGAESWFQFIHGNVSFFILENPEAEVRNVGRLSFQGRL